MLEAGKKEGTVEALIGRANPKAYVADAAQLAIREVGMEYRLGKKNEDMVINGIKEAMVRFSAGETPQTVTEWKRIAFISGEELLRDLALLGFDESEGMIGAYHEAVDAYLAEILKEKRE
ncbi:hypothetical protein HY971_00505 [Candidatus Kaiserbacteria bacterium]|nr:hypothetical protein [Candidatus Kaiserbacteria bacterium]